MAFFEKFSRSAVKTITFRIVVMASNAIVVFAITQRVDLAVSVLVATNIINTAIYFIHERVWNRIEWGKHEHDSRS